MTPHAYAPRGGHFPGDALRHVIEAAVAYSDTFVLLHLPKGLSVFLTSPHRTAVVNRARGVGATAGGSDAVLFYGPPLPPPPAQAVRKRASGAPLPAF